MSLLNKFSTKLEDRIAELELVNNLLFTEIEGLEDIKPKEGWSISEISQHLYIVEKGITGMLKKALESSERCETKTDEYLKKEWETILAFTLNRQEKFNAPSFTHPSSTLTLSETVNALKEIHEKLVTLLKKTSKEELASIAKPHARESVGLITGLGWITLIASHKLRHIEQIKELKTV
jgi:hypothetical protein